MEEVITNFSDPGDLYKYLNHPKYSQIQFRESDHKYYIHENKRIREDYVSVTTIVSMCFPTFDKKKNCIQSAAEHEEPYIHRARVEN